jgi:DNA-binding SARP family transcriptional activator
MPDGVGYHRFVAGPDLQAHLLGGFAVEVDGQMIPAADWRRRGAADLVKLLALAPGHRLSREEISEALWPALTPDRGAANVRKAAHYARRALGADSAVVAREGSVYLAPDGSVDTDVERFEHAARDAVDRADRRACRKAVAIYPGELLPGDRYSDWCSGDRDRLRLLFLEALAGGEQWGRLVEEDPANERAHRQIMRAQLDRGDRRAALRQFEHMRSALRELGVTPDDASIEVYEEALAIDSRDAPTPAERARTLLAWGIVHWERADLDEAERAALEVRALAVDAGLGREFIEASGLLGVIAVAQGSWRELFGRSFADALEHHPHLAPFVYDAHVCMSEFSLHERDGLSGAQALATQLLSVGGRSGSTEGRSLGLLLRGEAALLAGDMPTARECLLESMRLQEDGGPASSRTVALERLAQLEDSEHDHERATELHRRALSLGGATPLAGHLLPFIYGGIVAGTDASELVSVLDEAEDAMAAIDVCEPCSMAYHVESVAALTSLGDVAGAHRHLDEAERIANRWPGGPWHAAVAEGRSLVLRAEGGSRADVLELLTKAREGYRVSGRVRDEKRCTDAIAEWSDRL